MKEPEALLTPKDVARRLAVGRTTVFMLLRSGELASVKIGRSRRIPTSAVDEFIHRHLGDRRS
jgi:excisionase family DNA binding protein